MRYFKRFFVVFFVTILVFSSVFISYEKGNKCYAVAILPFAVEGGLSLVEVLVYLGIIGGLGYTAYELTDDSTDEEWGKSYAQDKEVYDKLQNYYKDMDASAYENAYLTDAYGQPYYLADIMEEDFPSMSQYVDLKKNKGSGSSSSSSGGGSSSSGGGSSRWGWISLGTELIDLLEDFFEDECGCCGGGSSDLGGNSHPQFYFEGDSGYINRETGEVNIYFLSDALGYDSGYHYYWNNFYDFRYNNELSESSREFFRAAVVINNGTTDIFDTSTNKYYRAIGNAQVVWGYIDSCAAPNYSLYATQYYQKVYFNAGQYTEYDNEKSGQSKMYGAFSCKYSDSNDPNSYNLANWDYMSSNVPIFLTVDEAVAYLNGGDASAALNLPPGTATPTPAITATPSSTAVGTYLNSIRGKYINRGQVDTFIDTLIAYTEENGITISNTSDDYIEALKSLLDNQEDDDSNSEPYPGYSDDSENDGEGFSLWKLFEWLLGFFTIDTDKINAEMKVGIVAADSFKPLTDAFSKMKKAFGKDSFASDSEEAEVSATTVDSGISVEEQAEINGSKLVTDYPLFSVKVPKVLDKYLKFDGETIRYIGVSKSIVICDFEDYAEYFVKFRAFIKAVLWIGMLFYLMKEFKVSFSVS